MTNSRTDWASIGQLILALGSISLLMGMASMLLIFGASQLIALGAAGSSMYGFMPGISMAAVAMLILPSGYYAVMRILAKKPVDSIALISKMRPGFWILALPLVLLFGYLAARTSQISWLLLPPLQVLAIGIPLVWLLYLAIRRLPVGSSQRLWGVFNAGLFLAPALIVVFELMAGLGFFLVGVIYIASNPELVEKMTALAEQMRALETQQELLQLLAPLLVKPKVILGLLLFAAIIVPLIEELVKPIGVWLLAGRKMTPAAGFAAGAISGSGYALVESLMFNVSSQDWLTLVLARNGTTAIHILTSAITGWALVQAWQKKRFARLGLAYFFVVIIHGTWNGMTVIYTFQALAKSENLSINLPLIAPLGSIAPFVLGLIAVGCFSGLMVVNRILQKAAITKDPLLQDKGPAVEE